MGINWSVERKPPTGLTRLNDSVWELYSPQGEVPEIEIIFFHGLQLANNLEDAFWTTWLALDDDVLWPKEWLSEILPNARILSIAYTSERMDMYTSGEKLVQDIILAKTSSKCPVFLVGHCLGGTVIKHFILSAISWLNNLGPDHHAEGDRISEFLRNFQGAFFYATPHGGSRGIEELIRSLKFTSPILELLRTLNASAARINEQFRQQRRMLNARTFAVAEAYPTTFQGFNGIVVEEGSSRIDMDNFYTVSRADHFTICRARSKKDPAVIGQLARFIKSSIVSILPLQEAMRLT